MIAAEHRVPVGTYNYRVSECFACGEFLTFRANCAGFNDPPFVRNTDYQVAVVLVCPACGERQWNHGDERSYERFCGRLRKIQAPG